MGNLSEIWAKNEINVVKPVSTALSGSDGLGAKTNPENSEIPNILIQTKGA